MVLPEKNIRITVDDYLDSESRSDVKHEYDNGFIVAMVGASRKHNLLAGALFSVINNHLQGKPCRAYISDMKLRIQNNNTDLFYYPDVMVSCDENPTSEYYEENPVLVIKVLSPSTEMRDKLEKLAAYSRITSLKEYMLIAQDTVEISLYRLNKGETYLTVYRDGDAISLQSIGLKISVKSIYERLV